MATNRVKLHSRVRGEIAEERQRTGDRWGVGEECLCVGMGVGGWGVFLGLKRGGGELGR